MNQELFNVINEFAGKNHIVDAIVIFCAKYLIYILFAAAAGLIGYLVYKRQWRPVIFFSANLALTFALLLIASKLHLSDRPFVDGKATMLIHHAATQSFPSDHMTASIAVAFGLTFFTRYKFIGSLAIIAACLIGFSRIVAGVHYPLDIAGAIAIGIVASICVGVAYAMTKGKQQSVKFDVQS